MLLECCPYRYTVVIWLEIQPCIMIAKVALEPRSHCSPPFSLTLSTVAAGSTYSFGDSIIIALAHRIFRLGFLSLVAKKEDDGNMFCVTRSAG